MNKKENQGLEVKIHNKKPKGSPLG